jgi:hypothetical protein
VKDAPTFFAMIVVKPLWGEHPGIQSVFEAIHHQRLATNDDVQQDQLLEVLQSLLFDRVAGDAVDVLEIVGAFDQLAKVKIRRNGFERGAGPLGRHICVFTTAS